MAVAVNARSVTGSGSIPASSRTLEVGWAADEAVLISFKKIGQINSKYSEISLFLCGPGSYFV
jgi:hypothetical protein